MIENIYEIQKKAEEGDAYSQHEMGVNFQYGYGVPVDKQKSLEWFQKAAENGYSESMRALGIIYEGGVGVEQDLKKAFDYYVSAVDAGNVKSLEKLAEFYKEGIVVHKNDNKARELLEAFVMQLQKNAISNNADAMWRLGQIYQDGNSLLKIPVNLQQAAYWYEKAAELGYMYAQTSLGILYMLGLGVPKNYKKAAQLYQKAAEQGDSAALYNLAGCFRLGRGVEQNDEKAAFYNQKAANMEMPEAQTALAQMYYNGLGVEKDYSLAVHWYKKAINNGYANAYYGLGCCYHHGLGVEKNQQKAFQLFELGEQQGDRHCLLAVAECCIEGIGTTPDYTHAKDLLEDICNEHEDNLHNARIATIEHENDDMAFWFNPLDENLLSYYAKAYYLLGILYYSGQGSDKASPSKAIACLRLAERFGYVASDMSIEKLISKIEGEQENQNNVHKSYIEIRDLGKRGRMGNFDIIIHHADGTESNTRYGTDREKFCYLLLLLMVSNKNSIQGLMARYFCYARERLVSLAELTGLADENGSGIWIDKFIYKQAVDSDGRWYYQYDNNMYSNEMRKTTQYFDESCDAEELELYKARATGGRDSVYSIAVKSDQIVVPDSLRKYTKDLPSRDFLLSYKHIKSRNVDYEKAKKLPNNREKWDNE